MKNLKRFLLFALFVWTGTSVLVNAGFLGVKKSTESISFRLQNPLDSAGIPGMPDSAHIFTYADNATTATYSARSTTYPFSDISIDTTKNYGDTAYWFVDAIADIDGAGGNIQLGIDVVLWYKKLPTHTFATVQVISDSLNVAVDTAKQARIGWDNDLIAEANRTITIPNDGITGAKIADNAIGSTELAANAITSAEIQDGAITSTKFAAGAITSTVIADDAITGAKIAPSSIGSSDFVTGAIDASVIGAGAIGTSEAPLLANLDATVSSRSSFNAASDSVLVDMSAFNAALDDDTSLVNFLRAGIGGTVSVDTMSIWRQVWRALPAGFADSTGYIAQLLYDTMMALMDSAQNQDDWVAQQTTLAAANDTLQLLHYSVKRYDTWLPINGDFERDSATAGNAVQGWVNGGLHADCYSKSVADGDRAEGRWKYHMEISSAGLDTLHMSQNVYLSPGVYQISFAGRQTAATWAGVGIDSSSGSVMGFQDSVTIPFSVTINNYLSRPFVVTEYLYAYTIRLVLIGDAAGENADFDNIRLIHLMPYDFGGIYADGNLIDSIWDEDSTGHYTSPNMAFVSAQTAASSFNPATDSVMVDVSTALTNNNLIGKIAAHTADSTLDEDTTGHYTSPNFAYTASQTAASSLDSATISRIVKRVVWGIATGSGSDSSTVAQRLITLLDDGITAAKIAANAIDAGAIATDAITAAKIAANTITNSEFDTTAINEIVDSVWSNFTRTLTDSVNAKARVTAMNADVLTASALAASAAAEIADSVGSITASVDTLSIARTVQAYQYRNLDLSYAYAPNSTYLIKAPHARSDDSGKIHPSIWEFEEPWGPDPSLDSLDDKTPNWKYWLGYTGNTYEEICIAASYDGYTFVTPFYVDTAGDTTTCPHPVVDTSVFHRTTAAYADVNLFFDNDTMYLYFAGPEIGGRQIYCIRSINGVQWTDTVRVVDEYDLVPTVLKDGSFYVMYLNNGTRRVATNPVEGFLNANVTRIDTLNFFDKYGNDTAIHNHTEFRKIGENDYICISPNSGAIASSHDGINFTVTEQPFIYTSPTSYWDGRYIYKGTFWPRVTERGILFDFWYSAGASSVSSYPTYNIGEKTHIKFEKPSDDEGGNLVRNGEFNGLRYRIGGRDYPQYWQVKTYASLYVNMGFSCQDSVDEDIYFHLGRYSATAGMPDTTIVYQYLGYLAPGDYIWGGKIGNYRGFYNNGMAGIVIENDTTIPTGGGFVDSIWLTTDTGYSYYKKLTVSAAGNYSIGLFQSGSTISWGSYDDIIFMPAGGADTAVMKVMATNNPSLFYGPTASGSGANAVRYFCIDTSGTDTKVFGAFVAIYSTDFVTFYAGRYIENADSGVTFNLNNGDYGVVITSTGYIFPPDTVTVTGVMTDSLYGYDIPSTYPAGTKSCLVTGKILAPLGDSVGGLANVVIFVTPNKSNIVDSAGNIIGSGTQSLFTMTDTGGNWAVYVPYTNYLIPATQWRFKAQWPGGGLDTRDVEVPSQVTGTLKKDTDGHWYIE